MAPAVPASEQVEAGVELRAYKSMDLFPQLRYAFYIEISPYSSLLRGE